jgi:hypothetical protein
VCSELVYKAYEPSRDLPGLKLPLVELMGRQVLPPNEIARLFDQDFGTAAQQFDLVVFLDGHEKEGVAVPADVAAFRRSWTRPKWHVFVQDELPAPPAAR